MQETKRRTLAASGYLVGVFGTVTTVAVVWIDHMNSTLWALMATGIAASVLLSATMLHAAREV